MITNPLVLLAGVSEYGSERNNLPSVREEIMQYYNLFRKHYNYDVRTTFQQINRFLRFRASFKGLGGGFPFCIRKGNKQRWHFFLSFFICLFFLHGGLSLKGITFKFYL